MRTTRQVLAALITIAFVVIVVSGLVLSFPALLLSISAASLFTWRSVHEWAALVFVVVVVVHLVVNRRRLGRLFFVRERDCEPESMPSPKAAETSPGSDTVARPSLSDGRRRADLSRKRFLLLGGAAVAGALVALTVERASPRRATGRSPEGRADFPVLSAVTGPVAVSAEDWVLQIDGLVERPQRLDRAAWSALPRTSEVRDFRCVQGWGAEDLAWEGVRVSEVLRRAEPSREGRFVTFHAYGGTYTDTLTLAQALAPETLLADRLDGEALPAPHGGPLRLVIPSQVGYKNVKWVVRLEVTAERAEGYWQRNGYPAEAPVS